MLLQKACFVIQPKDVIHIKLIWITYPFTVWTSVQSQIQRLFGQLNFLIIIICSSSTTLVSFKGKILSFWYPKPRNITYLNIEIYEFILKDREKILSYLQQKNWVITERKNPLTFFSNFFGYQHRYLVCGFIWSWPCCPVIYLLFYKKSKFKFLKS